MSAIVGKPPTASKPPTFTEAPAWENLSEGWHHLHGGFRKLGYSVEWHDFTASEDFEWSRSFHPGGLEICLNLNGSGRVRAGRNELAFSPFTAGFYLQAGAGLRAVRNGGERHQFITIELSRNFLERHVAPGEEGLHPTVAGFLSSRNAFNAVSETVRLGSGDQAVVSSLRHPPVLRSAQRLWYHAKTLEVASAFFYRRLPDEELFCQRQQRMNRERIQKVIAILKEDLSAAPTLEEIGKRVGCSHYYLSRTFTEEMGQTMTQYLRGLRMERAAELLREGKMNVTQAALEVGYSSLSHFSSAFHATFGCCPGLYPLATMPQRLYKDLSK